MKKRGFGNGLWNGSGGKPSEGETVEEAACREVKEELGVELTSFEKCGEIEFYLKKEDLLVNCIVFLASKWNGEVVETEEMNPDWFEIKDVPYDQMWKSDKLWLPLILDGKKIKAKFDYECEGGALLSNQISEL